MGIGFNSLVETLGALALLGGLLTAWVLMARRYEGASDGFNLWRMMARYGIGQEQLQHGASGEELAAVARACYHCRAKEACEDWLAKEEPTSAPAFCPNRVFFVDLKERQAAG